MAQVAPQKMTAAEYAKLPETMQIMDLMDGQIILTPTPTHDHQAIVIALLDLLRTLSPQGRRGFAPNDVYLEKFTVLQPDVFWVRKNNSTCKLGTDNHWYGAPDLTIEVMSSDTELRDRREKFTLYEKHGVREYWIADPAAQVVEVYRLEKRIYQRIGVFGRDDNFESTVLKAEIVLGHIFGPVVG